MPKRPFRRRTYHSLADLRGDIRHIVAQRRLLRTAVRDLISPAFRERLMLVVTRVSGCRYCSYYHARLALRSGVVPSELRDLLAGHLPGETPSEEYLALLYAEHWAESDAKPDSEAVQRLSEAYGAQKAAAIEILLRMIRVGNLLGNTADYLLYRLSFGLIGLRDHEVEIGSK